MEILTVLAHTMKMIPHPACNVDATPWASEFSWHMQRIGYQKRFPQDRTASISLIYLDNCTVLGLAEHVRRITIIPGRSQLGHEPFHPGKGNPFPFCVFLFTSLHPVLNPLGASSGPGGWCSASPRFFPSLTPGWSCCPRCRRSSHRSIPSIFHKSAYRDTCSNSEYNPGWTST